MKKKIKCNCGHSVIRTGKDAVKATSGKAKIKPIAKPTVVKG